ncbi:MAG TPA: hypothetical protein VGQ96_06710, partial [Candidatus Eremiobacteraceae bacterium]|nr:hypothetical protein [Candidatus Eremiobacteraceae bacterium]
MATADVLFGGMDDNDGVFSIPRVNVVQSSEGYSVEVLGRTGLQYIEGERRLFVDSEVLVGDAGLVIYAGSIVRWDPPNAA